MDGSRFDQLTRTLATGTTRRGLFTILGGGAALLGIRSTGVLAAPKDKVTICHRGDDGVLHPITISQRALSTHLAHGDGTIGTLAHCGSCGDACAADQTCQSGGCVDPCVAANCPGEDTECQTRVCLDTGCGFENQPSGTPVTAQTAGDCKRNVCNGSGGIVAIPDDDDFCSIPGAFTFCSDGGCHFAGCDVFWGDCNGDLSDGCETPLDFDDANCGACGHVCGDGELCFFGVCEVL